MIKNILLIFCIAFLMQSCITMKAPQVKGIENFKTGELFSTTPAVTFDVKLHNPNNFGLQLRNVTLNLYTGNSLVGSFTTPYNTAIGRGKDFAIPFRLEPSIEQISTITMGGIKNAGSIKGKGSVTVKKFIFKRKFDFSF